MCSIRLSAVSPAVAVLQRLFLVVLFLSPFRFTSVAAQGDSLSVITPSADEQVWRDSLHQALDGLLGHSLLETSVMGFCVYDLTADTLLYTYNARKRLRPASTQKLFTAVSGLDLLGPLYTFKTHISYRGRVHDGVLNGDLYVVGGFDPCFGATDMAEVVSRIKEEGIRRINGRLVADVSMKDTLKWGSGWCWDDDNPVLTPLLYGGKDGFMKALISRLDSAGIACPADFTYGVCPISTVSLARIAHSVDDVLGPMMKKSDNLYAESFFYQIAAVSGRKYAGNKQARRYMNDWVKKMGLFPEDYYIADGSGLSLYNYLTPELELALLRYAYHVPFIYEHLLPSLPIAGVDGTLERRMKNGPACGRVRAKTGTLEGVSSLAGYAEAANGHMLAFCIMNQGCSRGRDSRDFQDRFCEILCR